MVQNVDELIKTGLSINHDSIEFIRYYSSTYQTEWEGQERELVAEILDFISNEAKPSIASLNCFSSL